jgi:stress response protein SCP2
MRTLSDCLAELISIKIHLAEMRNMINKNGEGSHDNKRNIALSVTELENAIHRLSLFVKSFYGEELEQELPEIKDSAEDMIIQTIEKHFEQLEQEMTDLNVMVQVRTGQLIDYINDSALTSEEEKLIRFLLKHSALMGKYGKDRDLALSILEKLNDKTLP